MKLKTEFNNLTDFIDCLLGLRKKWKIYNNSSKSPFNKRETSMIL